MANACCEWNIKHALGDKNKFGPYFQSHNFTWRLVLVSTDKHLVFLEHFGYLTFDVFTSYVLRLRYSDGEVEEREIVFVFGTTLENGQKIKEKQVEKVEVEILSAQRCYEAKKDTPYAGMVNLGSTCYLNSIMQTLFHIKEFERELFKQSLGKKTLEMQKLFYQLEKEAEYVKTASFANVFKLNEPLDDQQDVQEFFKVLLDELEKEAKGTEFFDYIENTFYGTLAAMVECENGCKSERTEKYNDIQLVLGMQSAADSKSSLEDALRAYVNTTTLEEPNLYKCDQHGYVKATKKDYFKTFPPVLFFQIKRFNMNYDTGDVYKLNGYFSFPQSIDLAPYTEERDEKNVYALYSVIVHLGDGLSEGHYYTYIRKGAEWYKFNDCYVTKSSKEEAVEGTFGGEHEYKNKMKVANAYYLVYVKEARNASLLGAEVEQVPEEVREVVERDIFMCTARDIDVVTEEIAKGYWGAGAFLAGSEYMKTRPIRLKMENLQTATQLKMQIRRILSSGSAAVERVVLYKVEGGKMARMAETEIVGDLRSGCVFAVENREEVEDEDIFLVFLKREKAVGQPFSLKVSVETSSVHCVSRKMKVREWVEKSFPGCVAPLAEKSEVEEVPEDSTFGDLFEDGYGVIVLDAGKEVLSEYLSEVKTHKIVPVYINEILAMHLWQDRNWGVSGEVGGDGRNGDDVVDGDGAEGDGNGGGDRTNYGTANNECHDDNDQAVTDYPASNHLDNNRAPPTETLGVAEDARRVLKERLGTDMFDVISASGEEVKLVTKTGYVVVNVVYLEEGVENANRAEKRSCIVPEVVTGEVFLNIFGVDEQELRKKMKLAVTYEGNESITAAKIHEKVKLANGALVTLQEISRKTHAEASVKYSDEIIGHPFFINVDQKRSAMEIKRRCGVEDSTLVKSSSKKQSVIEDTAMVKRSSSSDKFVFLINFLQRWKMQNAGRRLI